MFGMPSDFHCVKKVSRFQYPPSTKRFHAFAWSDRNLVIQFAIVNILNIQDNGHVTRQRIFGAEILNTHFHMGLVGAQWSWAWSPQRIFVRSSKDTP